MKWIELWAKIALVEKICGYAVLAILLCVFLASVLAATWNRQRKR